MKREFDFYKCPNCNHSEWFLVSSYMNLNLLLDHDGNVLPSDSTYTLKCKHCDNIVEVSTQELKQCELLYSKEL